MARDDKTTGNVIVLILVVALVGYILVNLGGSETFSLVNVDAEKTTYRAGEEETFHINLRTVDPAQFTTPTHFREQFGRWRIMDEEGNIVSPGKQTQIEGGVYNQLVTITIPNEYSKIYFVAEIIEFQWSAPDPDGKFIRDDGSLRTEETIELNIVNCVDHAECEVGGTCLGQYGYCTEGGLCEVRGECRECVAASDCAGFDEAISGVTYECIDYQCIEYVQPTFTEQIKESFSEPITEPAPVAEGEDPKSPPPGPAAPRTAAGPHPLYRRPPGQEAG